MIPLPLHHLHEQYKHSAKLSDEVHLFWTLTSSAAASSSSEQADVGSSSGDENNGSSSDVNEIQFAVAYNLPTLALHDHDEDDKHLQTHDANTDKQGGEDEEGADDANNNYWLAFGISPQGGMIGADFMIYLPRRQHTQQHHQQDQQPLLLDAHGIQYTFPIIDSCGQDWTLLNSSILHYDNDVACNHQCDGCNKSNNDKKCNNNNHNNNSNTAAWHILQVKRALSSNDVNQDVPFLNDSSSVLLMTNPTFVLAAWGELKNGSERESDGRRMIRRSSRRRRSLEEEEEEEGGQTSTVSLSSSSAATSGGASDEDKDVSIDDYNSSSGMDLTSMLLPHGPLQRVSTTVRFFDDKSQPEDVDDDSRTIITPASSKQQQNQSFNEQAAAAAFLKMPYIDLIPKQPFLIPGVETTYKNFCFTITDYPQLIQLLNNQQDVDDKTVHIIGFQNIIQSGSPVHHMDLHGTTNPILGSDTRLCRVYMDLIHPWEAGSPKEFVLPLEAGIPMGYSNDSNDSGSSSGNGGGGYKAFRLEVHYHNPRRKEAMLDQSGVRIYYSIEKRKNVAGLMLLGDYMLKLRGSYTVGGEDSNEKDDVNSTTIVSSSSSKEVVGGGMKHSFYCPSSCFSKKRLGRNKNVTVFREVLHMHQSGERMTNIHLNSNGTILHASEANYFDFSRGAGYGSRMNLPYQITEGDSFVTSCYFATKGVTWGSSSGEEMCQSFMWYYPQEDFSLTCGYADALVRRSNDTLDPMGCEVSYGRKQVSFELERLQPSEQCQAAEMSSRPTNRFDATVNTRQEWPSLSQLVTRWKRSRISVDPNDNSTRPSSVTSAKSSQSTLQKDCHLCPNGERPTHPDIMIEGFSWTCDELDAAIPVLYTEPELLFFSPFDVPPCEDYNAAFGKLCCSADKEVNAFVFGVTREYSLAIMVLASLLTLVMILIKRHRAQSVGRTSVLEITGLPLT